MTKGKAKRKNWRKVENSYAHMCRDEHVQIGHNDNSSEMCPLCREIARAERAEQRILELNCDKSALTEKCETLQDAKEAANKRIGELSAYRDQLEADILAIRAERDAWQHSAEVRQYANEALVQKVLNARKSAWSRFWRIPSFGALIARYKKAKAGECGG